MGIASKIEWTDHTFSIRWGCQKVSEGCDACYADALSHRWGFDIWGPRSDRRIMSDAYWAAPLKWNRAAAKTATTKRVFCSSMADVFEDASAHAPNGLRDRMAAERSRLWTLIDATPWLIWLLLTKRPENVTRMLPMDWSDHPRRNVHVGATMENRRRYLERVDVLRTIPAAVRFISAEPLLEDLGELALSGIDQVIVGAESGPGARPMDEAWVRSIRDQCEAANVAFFYKQKIEGRKKVSLPMLDGRQHADFSEAR
jgi:protein gp37